ncbi:hypothetical protein CCP4SC76_5490003 [Gammaproteobacteria bacterium]
MLYRRPNSAYWWVRFKDPSGREIRQSTGAENRKDAEEYEAKLKLDLPIRSSRTANREFPMNL